MTNRMKNAEARRIAARRRQNAKRQRDIRRERDRLHQCRTCGAPAVRSERTGQLTTGCRKHLDADMRRKEVYLLPWGAIVRPHRGKPFLELEYQLEEHLP